MKSKIGKLGKIGDVSESAEYKFLTRVINEIIEKQGKIIDHLNSQSQPEEYEKRIRIKGELSGETEHIKAHKEYLATSKQDTPEEWEENISILIKEGLFEEVTDDKGERVLGYIGCSDKVLKEIKQLLDDREREVLEKERTEVSKLLMKHACNEVPDNIPFGMDIMVREVASEGRRIWAEYEERIGKMEKLDKLNSKKK